MTYSYVVYCDLLLANAQRTQHFHQWSKVTRAARDKSRVVAKIARIPHLERVKIAIYPGQGPTKAGHKPRLADALNHAPIAKAVIDGLVDAGVIDDDNPTHVVSVTMHAPERTKQHQVRITIASVAPETYDVGQLPTKGQK